MGKSLVIVESPAKAKTINKYLGKDFQVEASIGHIKDLPKNKLGVDVEKGTFEPELIVIPGKEKVVDRLKKLAAKADAVYLAPDPDREGEAIAAHLAEELKEVAKPEVIFRVTFNEITADAVKNAFDHARHVDKNLVDAQQTRRVLDRIVGYQISPLLWDKVRRGLSAGRVQTVALRLIVEREQEIKDFQPVEYWTIDAVLESPAKTNEFTPLIARFIGIDGERVSVETVSQPAVADGKTAREIVEASLGAKWSVRNVERKERKRSPQAPFTTSKLQQGAAGALGFNVRRTMGVAQRLYEGVELGSRGAVGLITYMRTDSTRVAPEAIQSVRGYIGRKLGEKYLPEKPNSFKSKKDAQDAHEAIRPADPEIHPDEVRRYVPEEQYKLYKLIWQRFVASQMMPAIYDQTTVEIAAQADRRYDYRVSGSILKFEGYLKVYNESIAEEEDQRLPELSEKTSLQLASAEHLKVLAEREREKKREDARKQHRAKTAKVEARNEKAGVEEALPEFVEPEVNIPVRAAAVAGAQKFTEPPPRYNEASLVKELEERGIGRPSTYATIITTIQDREYVVKMGGRTGKFIPTEIGTVVTGLLVKNFPYIFDSKYTARLEEELDDIEDGKERWTDLLNAFYGHFAGELVEAAGNMEDIKRMEKPTDQKCDLCGSPLVLKWGKFGSFYACSAYAKEKPVAVPATGWKKDPQKVIAKVESKLEYPMEVKTTGDGEPGAVEVKDKAALKAGLGNAVGSGRKVTVEQVSCDFTRENFEGKPNLAMPTGDAEEQEEYCENCGRVMVKRNGPWGPFMACPGYNEDPPCKTIRKLSQKQQQKPPRPLDEKCPKCGEQLVLRNGQYGEFVSCSGYPKCKYIKQNTIGMKCPLCHKGEIVEKKARRGNVFYGCSEYPKCEFTANFKPVDQKCPECGSPYLMEKTLKSGVYLVCPNNKKPGAEDEGKSKGKKKAESDGGAACSFTERIGDAPAEEPAAAKPKPTAATHGPVVEEHLAKV